MNAKFPKGLAVNEKAGLKPRYFLGRPVLKGVVLAQRIEQNVEGSQLETAFLVLGLDLLLDQILNKQAGIGLFIFRSCRVS